jgi:hypothetical protein
VGFDTFVGQDVVDDSTAFQAMIVYGEVKPNDNVLVHAGASGIYLYIRPTNLRFHRRTQVLVLLRYSWLVSMEREYCVTIY